MLIIQTLEADILTMLTDLGKRESDPKQAKEDFARMLASAIDTYIKTAKVTVTVMTTGTAAAQTGTGTGNLT